MILLGEEPTVQQAPSLLTCSSAQLGGGLQTPVLGSIADPGAQHFPDAVTGEPGAQHCVAGHAVPPPAHS
jgi:hypothetical protein